MATTTITDPREQYRLRHEREQEEVAHQIQCLCRYIEKLFPGGTWVHDEYIAEEKTDDTN
jgi:hypothetical protein